MTHELCGRLDTIIQTSLAEQRGHRSVPVNQTNVAAPRKSPQAAKAMNRRPPEVSEKNAAVRRPSAPVNPATVT